MGTRGGVTVGSFLVALVSISRRRGTGRLTRGGVYRHLRPPVFVKVLLVAAIKRAVLQNQFAVATSPGAKNMILTEAAVLERDRGALVRLAHAAAERTLDVILQLAIGQIRGGLKENMQALPAVPEQFTVR